MIQEKRVVRKLQEYPGSYIWKDYEYKCPTCKKWTENISDVDEKDDDGDWHHLCEKCAEPIIKESFSGKPS